MSLRQLQTFVRLAESRSYSDAARALDVPTSSVSRAITALELDLGVKLFERTTRRLALTPLGRTYYEHVSRALAELREGERKVGEQHREPGGEVRVTASADLDDGFFARCLARFSMAHPKIRVTCTLSNDYADLIADGIDLAVRVADGLPDSSLVARPLGRYRAHLVASPDYVARRGLPRSVSDLARHDCVVNAPRGRARWTLTGPEGTESVDVIGKIAADDLRFARALLLAGAGIGVLAIAPGGGEKADGEPWVRVLPEHTLAAPTLYVVAPSSRRMPARVALLRDHLVASYADARP